MIETIWKRIESFASIKSFLTCVLLFVVFTVFFFNPISIGYPPGGTFDGRVGTPPDQFGPILREFQLRDQLQIYRTQEYGDLVFPIVYTLGLAIAIVGLGRVLPVPHALVLVPLLGALGDYTENLSILAILRHYEMDQTVPHALAVIASTGSVLKWGATWVSLGAMLVIAAWRLVHGLSDV